MFINNLYSVFAVVLQMSLIASVAIIILLFMRPFMKNLPKILSYLLWGIVLFRLLCPVSFQSPISILRLLDSHFVVALFSEEGSAQEVSLYEDTFEYDISDEVIVLQDEIVTQTVVSGEIAEESHSYQPTEITQLPVWKRMASVIWMLGIGIIMGYGICSYISLRKKLVGAVKGENGIYSCDYIKTAFVLGFVFPRIYLPSDLEESKKEFIVLHEQVHVARRDSFFRMLAYIALAVHWFNPFVWIAFYLSGVDMELSCDEAVIRRARGDIRKEYAAALLEIASGENIFFAGFPAFGENQTKERIKSVVNYKKKSVIALVIGSVIVGVLILVLASDPKEPIEVSSSSTAHTNEEVEEGIREAFVTTKIEEWAKAFCNRDGNTIIAMSTPEARKVYEEGMLLVEEAGSASFGWSSPWPFMETDYSIKFVEENKAVVLYYARTSDPHITVWAENLEFELGENFTDVDDFKITNSEILYLDSIDNAAEFVLAYGEGINNTPMDYLTNGSGEALNRNAKENKDSDWYKDLFSPETAAISLLNLDSENVVIDVSEGKTDEEVVLTIRFRKEDNNSVLQGIKMIQSFGEDGIWIPQNYTDSVLMEDGNNYFDNYEFYKEELGDNFLEEFYEMSCSIDSDISRDGIDETIEVYTGNIGDGDSGFVCIKDIHGNLLFHEFAHAARAGWNMVFLSEDNFLMNVHMEDRETYGEYSYEIYRVMGKDEIQILAKDSFSFDMDRQAVDEQELITFMDTLVQYLEQSQLLLSTQEGELKINGLSEEELTLEDITGDWYLWKKIEQGLDLEPIG